MRKISLFITIILFTFSNGQELDSLKKEWFMVKLDSLTSLQSLATKFENCTFSNLKEPTVGKISKGFFYLEDYQLCLEGDIRKFVYKITNGEQSYFVSTTDVSFVSEEEDGDQAMVFFSTMNPQEKILYKNALDDFIKEFEQYRKDEQIRKQEEPIRESLLQTLDKPLVVYDFAFTNNYSIGFRIEVLNTSKLRIKYINFNVSGFNEVDDRVRTLRGEYSRTLRGVGPIEINGSASWEFETIWSDNIFYSGKINSITVEYFNGTKKTFTKVGLLTLSDEERLLLDKYLKQ